MPTLPEQYQALYRDLVVLLLHHNLPEKRAKQFASEIVARYHQAKEGTISSPDIIIDLVGDHYEIYLVHRLVDEVGKIFGRYGSKHIKQFDPEQWAISPPTSAPGRKGYHKFIIRRKAAEAKPKPTPPTKQDLLKQFNSLPPNVQQSIIERMKKSSGKT